ncbi:MAG: hypothetical protein V7K67_24670 [Nostoc sp.]
MSKLSSIPTTGGYSRSTSSSNKSSGALRSSGHKMLGRYLMTETAFSARGFRQSAASRREDFDPLTAMHLQKNPQ